MFKKSAPRLPREARRLWTWIVVIQGGLAALYLLIQFLPDTAGRLQAKFQFDPEPTFNTWWQIGLRLAAAGMIVFAIHHLAVPRSARRATWVLFWLMIFMSADEQVGLHETLGPSSLKDEATLQWMWPVLYSPILIVATWAIIRVALALPRLPRWLMLAGLGLQGLAVLLEVSASQYVNDGWPYKIEVLFEESAEGFGAGLVLLAFTLIALPALRRAWDPRPVVAPAAAYTTTAVPSIPEPAEEAPAARADGGLTLVRSAVVAIVLARHLRRRGLPVDAAGNGNGNGTGNGRPAADGDGNGNGHHAGDPDVPVGDEIFPDWPARSREPVGTR